ncbi:MAG: ribonucleoside triphosphate reductase [Candidatus Buchananbacteria bacterium]|nr:ribonucleoside triphosphate reductase [Candidatus Buchananbacteria bacterium]
MDSQIRQVKKRDGSIVDFDQAKITQAIYKSLKAVNRDDQELSLELSEKVINALNNKFHQRSVPAIEEIQDIVEEILIKEDLVKAAKAYIIYREQHARLRDLKKMINSNDIIDGYLKQLDWRVKENANMSYSLQGLNNHVASAISSHYWLNKIYPPEIRDAHVDGTLHLHDLQLLAVYCCGWDLQQLLRLGFGGVPGKVNSKPAKHLRVILGQIVNFFYTLQGEAAGAQAFANFDTLLAPFIRRDNLDYKSVKQSVQEFIFNVNVPTRVGFQTPFTNLTFDLYCPSTLANERIIIGGLPQTETYKEFQEEMNMINRAFAEVMMEGDAKGRVFTFPIPTYNISKDFDWSNEVLNPVWEMTAKYGIPYFANFVNSDMTAEDARSMCCRLRLDNRELRKRGGGIFAANPMTGSIGVVTINMSRIGYLSETKDVYFSRLGQVMDLARQSLKLKRSILENFTESGLYPYSKFYLGDIKERFNQYWKNHFNTIGINGMNESVVNFMNRPLSTAEGREFAAKVMDFMLQRMAKYQEEDDELYNLEATPAEGATYRFAKKDKELYPDIIVANDDAYKEKGAAPYYTNSTHLPVGYSDDIFDVLEKQDLLQTKYTGGTVVHGFIGEKMPNIESTKNLVRKIAENFHLPYYTLTPTFSICPKHGYLSGEHEFCPICDEEIGYVREQEEHLPL